MILIGLQAAQVVVALDAPLENQPVEYPGQRAAQVLVAGLLSKRHMEFAVDLKTLVAQTVQTQFSVACVDVGKLSGALGGQAIVEQALQGK